MYRSLCPRLSGRSFRDVSNMACCEESESITTDSPESFRNKSPALGPHQQGYDYDFVPALDAKYECPICLLCQREPTQTTCGHRFCRDCILTWLRRESQRCPEDNSPITAADVFPDNFAKREILCLKARCSNAKNGCTALIELSHMEEHQMACDYRIVICPSGCPMKLLQIDVSEHLAKECLYRIIECSLCQASFPLNHQHAHFETCSMLSVQCEHCRACFPRQDHARHLLECPNAIVHCPFIDVGCEMQLSRIKVDDHLNSNTQRHLRLLSDAHSNLRAFVDKMAAIVSTGQPNQFKTYPLRKESIPEIHIEQLTLQHDAPTNTIKEDDFEASASPKPITPLQVVPERSLLSSAECLMKELFQRNVQLEQRHREQELKMGTLRQQVAECETQVTLLLERMGSMSEAKFCNGIYLWKLDNFSRLVQEARSLGHSRLVHSPGFYTSVFGYKVCLRLNIVTKEHNNVRFVSLFIHLMQGECDEALVWPFVGEITFSILDVVEQRHHITETMTTKAGLVAFQRPTSERNPKGFGYMEFVAVDTLLSGRYIRNDSVLIKAMIKVSQDDIF